MATVDKEIADAIIAGKYEEDEWVKIVKYQNDFDGADAYGCIAKGQPLDMYHTSPCCHNPITYWEKTK